MLLSGSEKLESTVQKESDMLTKRRHHRCDTAAEDAARKQTLASTCHTGQSECVRELLVCLLPPSPPSPQQCPLPPSLMLVSSFTPLFLSGALIDSSRGVTDVRVYKCRL